ncbi:hypothetical protein BaRGS_00002915 [Batillaria attramentaria]|uniref:Uncharacterized protein n=1 Tax=Batillaria attramentaria TaxID=370345 RepID=A0ABD0M2V5_9CAEN
MPTPEPKTVISECAVEFEPQRPRIISQRHVSIVTAQLPLLAQLHPPPCPSTSPPPDDGKQTPVLAHCRNLRHGA